MYLFETYEQNKVQFPFQVAELINTKPAGRIKVNSKKKRTSYLMVVSLNVSFLRKNEEI